MKYTYPKNEQNNKKKVRIDSLLNGTIFEDEHENLCLKISGGHIFLIDCCGCSSGGYIYDDETYGSDKVLSSTCITQDNTKSIKIEIETH